MNTFRALGLALSWGLTHLAHAVPLTFAAALNLAEQHAPDLVAQATRVDATRAAQAAADALPDPKAFVGIDNFPLTGPDSGSLTADFMTMQKFGVMQEVPSAAKRLARKQEAQAKVNRDNAQLELDRRVVRQKAAEAWIKQYYVEKRLALLPLLEEENRLFAGVIRAQVAAGKASAADAITPRQELLEIEDRRDELRKLKIIAIARLKRLIGDANNDELAGDPPAISIDPAHLKHHLYQHPEFALLEPNRRLAEAALKKAKAAKSPDWELEFAYARRGKDFGDMVSLQFTTDLPLFTESRQVPDIKSKRLELERVEIKQQSATQKHTFELDTEIAELELLDHKIGRLQSQGIPLLQQKMALQLTDYRGGVGPVSAVLASRREYIDQRLKSLDLESKRSVLTARLSIFYGEQ